MGTMTTIAKIKSYPQKTTMKKMEWPVLRIVIGIVLLVSPCMKAHSGEISHERIMAGHLTVSRKGVLTWSVWLVFLINVQFVVAGIL